MYVNRACDRLDPERRQRLEYMVDDIDRHLEELMLEKVEYFKHLHGNDTMSRESKVTFMSNAYSFEGDLKS